MLRWGLSLLLCAASLLVTSGLAAASTDLIVNGGFEEVAGGSAPVGISTWLASGRATLAVDDAVAHSGQRSVRMDAAERSRAAFHQIVKDVAGGGTFKLTAWYRVSEGVTPEQVVMRVMVFKTDGSSESDKIPWSMEWVNLDAQQGRYWVDGNNFHIGPAGAVVPGEWQPMSVTFKLPAETTRIHIHLFGWYFQGTVWFDDFSLVPAEPFTTSLVDQLAAKEKTEMVMLRSLQPEHPRLLMSAADFAALKGLIDKDPNARMWYLRVKTSADRILLEPPSHYEIPDGKRLLATSRRVLDRIYFLALTYRIDGNPKYVERAWQELLAAAEFPDWNPSHFLDTAEMTHAFAIAYDWLYEQWSPEQRARLREAMVEMGLKPALLSYRGLSSYGWWVRATHNWNLVCNGGISMGALALADELPDLAEEILQEAHKSVPLALRRFAPDGGWDEGVGYWHYSVRYATPYLAALQSALGNTFGLAEIQGYGEAGYFPIYMTGPIGQTFNFADGGSGTVRAAEMFWLARAYKKPEYAWWQLRTAGSNGGPLDLIWYRPELAHGFDASQLPLDRYFREVEVASFRSSWEDPDATFIAFKAGDNAANHGNLDMGSFVLDAMGVRWAEELGADDYNLPGYFGAERWQYYRTRTEGQNTLVINPDGSPGQDPRAVGRIVFQESKPGEAVAIADLTPAYRQQAKRVERGFALLDNRRQILIQDEVETRQPFDVWWFMHTKAEITISPDGKSATLSSGGKRLWARILSPADARFEVMSAVPLPGSPNPTGQNPNGGIRKLTIHLEDVTDLRLAVQFVPLAPGEAAPVAPAVKSLAEWRQAGSAELWSELPRVQINVQAPAIGVPLKGSVPMRFSVAAPAELPVQQVAAYLGEEPVYQGAGADAQAEIDVRPFPDGQHTFTVEAVLADGSRATYGIPVRVANWWHLSDPLDPPVESGWFGTLVRTHTNSESPGWEFATEPLGPGLTDTGRKARRANTAEYLIWDTPNLRRFALQVYATAQEELSVLELAVSADGATWQAVPYTVAATEQAGGDWRLYRAAGELPAETPARWFKATLLAGGNNNIQIGQVELSGVSD